jgi:hypothetical protein
MVTASRVHSRERHGPRGFPGVPARGVDSAGVSACCVRCITCARDLAGSKRIHINLLVDILYPLQPGVYFVNTADNGDPLSVDTSIHTLDKLTVGRRLGAAVLATYYNQTDVQVNCGRTVH